MKNCPSASLAWHRRSRLGLLAASLAGLCLSCYAQLPADLDLPSETLNSGYLVFQASNSITSSSTLLIQDPATVTLTSANYIQLGPGFDAVATSGTATFMATINPNVVNWQPIPVPPAPTPCADCGLVFDESASGIIPNTVYNPSSTNPGYAYCVDENDNAVACDLALSTASYLNTNGHYHANPLPPISAISPASGYTGNYPNLALPATITTTQVGQFETVSVTPTDCGGGAGTASQPQNVIEPPVGGGPVFEYCIESNWDYAVGYKNLVSIGNSNIFSQTGGNTTSHGDNTFNHWMTVNAATGLQQAATYYINNYNPGQKICINDMALPLGGKFDLKANWQSPHITHDSGTAADVAVKSGQCNAISSNYLVNSGLFIDQCTSFLATEILLECTDATTGVTRKNCTQCLSTDRSCHVRCRWAN